MGNWRVRSGLSRLPLALLAGLWPLLPVPASAHLVDMRFGDFYGGGLHVLTGLDYVLLLIALSFLAALQQRERGRWVIAAVPAGLLVGSYASTLAPGGSSAALFVTGCLALTAALVALGRGLPLVVLLVWTGAASAMLGFENGLAMAQQTDQRLFTAGITATGFLIVTLATAGLVQVMDWGSWTRIAVRALGSWMAAVSILLMALAMAGPSLS